jgi:hypothetical protein
VYDLGVRYGKGKPNQLVMEWLRHEHYNGALSGWQELIGNVDDDWIEYAKAKGLNMMSNFADPAYCGKRVETDHWGATLNAIFLHPPPATPKINRGDFGGWGGDLATFYGEWRDSDEKDGYKFCRAKLGSLTVDSTFKILDFIEDADAFNIATMLRKNPSMTIYEAAKDYYRPGGGYKQRFWTFYATRFDGDGNQGKIVARNMMVDTSDFWITTLRSAAAQKTAGLWPLVPDPWDLKDEELSGFVNGFISVLRDLTDDTGYSCSA